MPDSLIRTKLRLPFTRPGLVPRPRLQARIVEGLRLPLTLIIAPAGFGKTTLAACGVMGSGMPAAWLSLDKDDNQSGRFLTYLVAALQVADPQIGSEAAQLTASMQPPAPEAVLTSLINDLDAARAELALVLDDYQFISSQAVHAQVAFLLEHCPNSFHLLIATRSDPPLPLARLRARGQLVELRASDLRFTEPEARQFLNDVMGLHLDEGSVALLEERTEGWVAGLQMAALPMRDRADVRGFIQGFSGTNRYILDYLLEEVLAGQTPEIQRFLLHTSILARLSAPLCEALLAHTGHPDPGGEDGEHPYQPSVAILEYLDRENLFLVSLDDERTWFRYHHLFADLLRARLQQTQPGWVSSLQLRAAAWLEQNGYIPEAIQHLFAAREDDRAAGLIERYGGTRWAENDLSVVQMADNLPHELLLTQPKIGLYHAWLLINQGDIEKAFPLLNELAGAAPSPGEPWIQTIIRLALAFLIPPSSAAGAYPLPDYLLLDEIPADEIVLRDAADILYGMALGRRMEFDRAAEFSLMCIHREKMRHANLATPLGVQAIPTLVPFLAAVYIFQGRMHAANELCREFLGPIQTQGIRISTAGNLDVVLGGVLYEWNRLEEAEKQIRSGLQANEPWRNIMTDAFGWLALAHVLQAKGDFAGAMQVVGKFETRLQGQSRPVEFAEDFRTLRARVQLAAGDRQGAFQWADQVQHSPDYQRYPQYYRLTLARVRLAQGRYAEVEELLAEEPPPTMPGNRKTRQIETNLLLAAALAGQQRLPQALGFVDASLAQAEPEGTLRCFIDAGETVRELLAAYLRSSAPGHVHFARSVLEAFSPSGSASSPVPQMGGLVEPLSARELEVLHLMALGKTNQEIARQLIVAPGTIKAHAASIYRKLDAANRTEAVARAQKLGVLRPPAGVLP